MTAAMPSAFANNKVEELTLVMPSGTDTTLGIRKGDLGVSAVLTPNGLQGNRLSLQGSFDGINYYNAENGLNILLRLNVSATPEFFDMELPWLVGIPYIRWQSTAVQAADREFLTILHPR